MQTVTEAGLMLGLFNLGPGEIILFLALVLILFGAKKLPGLAKGLGEGFWRFRDRISPFRDGRTASLFRVYAGVRTDFFRPCWGLTRNARAATHR